MTSAHQRYFAVEMAVAAVISAVLSIAFVFIVFGHTEMVPVSGWNGVAADAVPQSFMIALMSCLVPTLLTRRRIAAGKVATLPRGPRLPRHPVLRALFVALVVAFAAGIAHAVIAPLFGPSWRFGTVLVFKPVYGALLGAGVAAGAIRAVLGDYPATAEPPAGR